MTRKEVSFLLKSSADATARVLPRIALEQRAFRVVRGWVSDPLFKTRSGRPAELKLRGGARSFAALVRGYGGDVTTVSVRKELERINAITQSREGKIKLRSAKWISQRTAPGRLDEFAQLLEDFIGTASQAIQARKTPLFFGFRESRVPSAGHAALFQRTFTNRAAALLAGVEEWRGRQVKRAGKRRARSSNSAMRVGLGVYLVRDDFSTDADS